MPSVSVEVSVVLAGTYAGVGGRNHMWTPCIESQYSCKGTNVLCDGGESKRVYSPLRGSQRSIAACVEPLTCDSGEKRTDGEDIATPEQRVEGLVTLMKDDSMESHLCRCRGKER
jgi:hypothetical protein